MKKTGSVYFSFSMQARNGFLTLFLFIWITLHIHQWLINLNLKKEEVPIYQVYNQPEIKKVRMTIPPDFKVNINSVDVPSLRILTVPDFLAERWLKYLKKGGRFRKIDDVKKLYGMTLPLYASISGHLFIKEKHKWPEKPFVVREKYGIKCNLLDINEADSTAWESLYGIGPYLAQKITLFRKSLGGFTSVEQVKETYGLRDSVFQSIRPCLILKKEIKPCLSINHSTQETLGKHPYIRYKLAKTICLYRENNGHFVSLEQLKNLPSINDSIYLKIKPYLTIETVGE